MSKSLYVAASPEKLAEIIRQAESRLNAQMTTAIAADQRAMTFSGFLATGTAAFLAWAITHEASDAAFWPIVVLIIGFAMAAIFAIISAQPTAWEMVGNSPSNWVEDVADSTPLHEGMAAMASYYAEMIEFNDRVMAGNASTMRLSLWAMLLTLFATGIVAILRL